MQKSGKLKESHASMLSLRNYPTLLSLLNILDRNTILIYSMSISLKTGLFKLM